MKADPIKVKIRQVETDEYVSATILPAPIDRLPSMHDGWRFNFDKLIRKLTNAVAYILVADETPQIVEGALIFELKNEQLAYMSYVEVAPHNQIKPKRYDDVAGCLIAFAFSESIRLCEDDFKYQLAFDVFEQNRKDQKKLESMYIEKYGAIHFPLTGGLCIVDDAGNKLITKYLSPGID